MRETGPYPWDPIAAATDDKYCSLSHEQRGWFHFLLDLQWLRGAIPPSTEDVIRLLKIDENQAPPMAIAIAEKWQLPSENGKTMAIAIRDFLDLCFPVSNSDGLRRNKKLEKIRAKKAHVRTIRKKAGRNGAKNRWQAKSNVDLTENTPGNGKTMAIAISPDSNCHNDSMAIAIESPAPQEIAIAIPIQTVFENLALEQKEKEKEKERIKEKEREREKALPGNREKDEAYEIFCRVYSAKNSGLNYVESKGDFVQLSRFRKKNSLVVRAAPHGWELAVQNYLAAPLTKHTIADLISRYAAFRRGTTDRYGVLVAPTTRGKRIV